MLIHHTSLAGRTLTRMGVRIAFVIIAATLMAYWHLYSTLQTSMLNGLKGYVDARGRGESEHFKLAEIQTRMMADEFMKRLIAMGDEDPQAEFDAIFKRYPDELIRVRPDLNDFRTKATVFVRHDVPLTADLRRRLVIAYRLLSDWGILTTNRFIDSFINMPEQLSVNYAPFVDWSLAATRETDIYTYETVWRSTISKNPDRKPFWTGIYFDEGAKKWMVSHVTPSDINNRWVVSTGQDIVIDDMVKRTVNEQLTGTYNIILRHDGELLAHPTLMEQIRKAGGNLNAVKLHDAALTNIVDAAVNSKGSPAIVETSDAQYFLGVTRIEGPNWIFVTVYPKSLLQRLAFDNASFVLGLGAVSLLLELLLIRLVLRRQVIAPLESLLGATERVRGGDWNIRINWPHQDEIGRLASSFTAMAQSLGERDRQLQRSAQDLATQVELVLANEARLQAISAAIPDAIYVLDREGNIMEAFGNQALFAMNNRRSNNVVEALPQDISREILLVVGRCLDTGDTQIYEYPLMLQGQLYWFEGRTARLPQHTAQNAVVWLARDVSARKLAEIELRQARDYLVEQVALQTADLVAAKEKADAANLAKTQFLSNMSHELRTPMHAILSFARLGLDKAEQATPDKLKRYFSNIADSGERMLALVNDLLDVTRLESGKMAFSLTEQPLKPLIESIMVELDELAKRQALQVVLQTDGTEPVFGFDRLRIGQVIRNLLSNAIKFSREHEQVLIELTTCDAPMPRAIVRVMDRGIGIPPDELEAIFDKFVQSSRTSRESGGSGLGLAISREIIRGHGGDIFAELREGGGSILTFWLPLAPSTNQPDDEN